MPKIIKFIRTGIERQNSSHIQFLTKSRMRILRSTRKDRLFFTKSLWFHVSIRKWLIQCCRSAPVRAIYTPYSSLPVINITPGTFQGSARSPKGSLKGLSQITPGPVRRGKWIFWPYPYGARPAPFRFHWRRDNFNNPYGRRCVEEAAPNFPGVFIKPTGRIRGPPEYQPGKLRV